MAAMKGKKLSLPQWTTDEEIQLIECYGQNRVLWDAKDPQYHKKGIRDKGLETIHALFGSKFTSKSIGSCGVSGTLFFCRDPEFYSFYQHVASQEWSSQYFFCQETAPEPSLK